MPIGASNCVRVRACCSARSSVGAISAAWKSFSTASSIAKSATTVLPGPDVAHQQAMHPFRRSHVGRDFANGPLLVVRQFVRERRLECRGEVALHLERDPAPLALGQRARADQHQLQVEELVEGQPAPAPLGVRHGRRTMHVAQRVRQPWQGEFRAGWRPGGRP